MWFDKSIYNTLKKVSSNKNGLSSKEALFRLEKYGQNKLQSKEKKSILKIFLSQLKDITIYILIGAAILSAIMGEYSDSIIILLVILINSILGVTQEFKAQKALDSLKTLSTPKALVKRDGVILEIPSEEVVIGDIVVIDAGRYIPADLRLIETFNLKIEESAFTGESLPSDKDANVILNSENILIGDRVNMAYMSTLATYGRGIGVCVSTGMDTEIGKIASMLKNSEEELTPLQKKLNSLGKVLGFLALFICSLIFIIGLLQGRDLFEMLLTSISLAVAAIPEGLPAIVSIVLALGVRRMIKNNAIIKKLPSVETLGSVNIICSDKTGTLTLNKMTVRKIFSNNKIKKVSHFTNLDKETKNLLEAMILCNDATVLNEKSTGDPTEISLLNLGLKYNLDKETLNKNHKRIEEIPFDSDRKLMSTINEYDNKYKVLTKGAIDSLLKISSKIMIEGEILDFTEERKKEVLKWANLVSDDALRVLGASYKEINSKNINLDEIENDLIFLGFVGMIDPPRSEVKEAISICKKSKIKTIMITGDHKNTAFAIGKELGIAKDLNECISGSEIDLLSTEEFNENIHKYKIFARVSPEHKVKIVKTLKSKGNIVSMTGDGVNDAPSLKIADIGVAMGITGTDVSKDASDMILTDDNFSTIVKAIKEGRTIYTNIRKSILFLLSCNLGEIIALFLAILLNWATPLQPIHILWVNLITDSFPALSLGVDKPEKNIMDLPPRNPKESIFSKKGKYLILINGLTIGLVTLVGFKLGEKIYPNSLYHAQTIAFVVLSLSQLIFSLSIRSLSSPILKEGILKNKYLIYSILFGITIQILIIQIPFLANIFKVNPLNLKDFIIIVFLSLIPFSINELIKIIRYKKGA